MRVKRSILVLIVAVSLISVPRVYADSKMDLINILNSMNQSRVYTRYAEYEIRGTDTSRSVITEVFTNGSKVKMTNSYVVSYADGQTAVSIFPANEMIVVAKLNDQGTENALNQWVQLVEQSRVLATDREGNKLKIRFGSVNKEQRWPQTTFVINEDTKKLVSVSVSRGEHQITVYNYLKIDPNYRGIPFSGKAKNQIMEGDKLKKRFESFEVKTLN